MRKDLAPLSYSTNSWLAMVIGVSVLGVLLVLAGGAGVQVMYA